MLLYSLVVVLLVALAVFVVIGGIVATRKKQRETFAVNEVIERTTTDTVIGNDGDEPDVTTTATTVLHEPDAHHHHTNRHAHARLSHTRHRHYTHTPHNHDATDIATVFPPEMHVREADAIEDEWDSIARRDKHDHNAARHHNVHCHNRREYDADVDAPSSYGYTLDPVRRTCPIALSSQPSDLTAYGHCTSSPTVWSTLHSRVARCLTDKRHRHKSRDPVHLSEVQASITDDSCVGTILPKFSYTEHYD